MRISIELPFFPGFYESALYNSDTSYWAIKEELEYYYQQDLLPETSYDGFCSFMENDVDEWDNHLFFEEDCRYISTMLGYMMYRENKDVRDDLVMATLEDIYAGSYVYILPESEARIKQEYDEGVENGTIVVPDPAQLELPFDTQ